MAVLSAELGGKQSHENGPWCKNVFFTVSKHLFSVLNFVLNCFCLIGTLGKILAEILYAKH